MSNFLYFLPKHSGSVTLDQLEAAGLRYVFDSPGFSPRQCQCGPDGSPGVIVATEGNAELGYFADRQTWRKVPDREVWVGMCRGQGPGAREEKKGPGARGQNSDAEFSLARRKQLAGHTVTLLDGQQWLVPVARGWIEQDGEMRWQKRLPVVSVLDDEGRWVEGDVVSQYAALWELAVQFDAMKLAATQSAVAAAGGGEAIDDAEPVTVELEFDVHDGAVAAMAANYRIGPVEASMLGLLTFELAIEVLNALIDEPTWLEWVKKNTADAGSNTDAGPPDSTPDTGRP